MKKSSKLKRHQQSKQRRDKRKEYCRGKTTRSTNPLRQFFKKRGRR